MLVNELYGVSAINNVGKALGKTAKFFTICILPCGAVFGVLDEMLVFHEFTGVFVEDGC